MSSVQNQRFKTASNELKLSRSQQPTPSRISALLSSLTKLNQNHQYSKSELHQQIKSIHKKVKDHNYHSLLEIQVLKTDLNQVQRMIQEAQPNFMKKSIKKQMFFDQLSLHSTASSLKRYKGKFRYGKKEDSVERINEILSSEEQSIAQENQRIQEISDNLNRQILTVKLSLAEREGQQKLKTKNLIYQTESDLSRLKKKFNVQIQNTQKTISSQVKDNIYHDMVTISRRFYNFKSQVKRAFQKTEKDELKIIETFQKTKRQVNELLQREEQTQQNNFQRHFQTLEQIFAVIQKQMRNK